MAKKETQKLEGETPVQLDKWYDQEVAGILVQVFKPDTQLLKKLNEVVRYWEFQQNPYVERDLELYTLCLIGRGENQVERESAESLFFGYYLAGCKEKKHNGNEPWQEDFSKWAGKMLSAKEIWGAWLLDSQLEREAQVLRSN